MLFGDVSGSNLTGNWNFAGMGDRLTKAIVATIRMRCYGKEYICELIMVCKLYNVAVPLKNK